VGAHAQTLLDKGATSGTILTGELWGDGDDGDVMQGAIPVHPGEELSPSGILRAQSERLAFFSSHQNLNNALSCRSQRPTGAFYALGLTREDQATETSSSP
jgi:hypothetical protein